MEGTPTLSQSSGPLSGLVRFLKSHPIVFLLLLTPGIPEYLSASSQITLLVINPLGFFVFLAANVALYGSGVILIREAKIRWRKGWASVFLLGVAYSIVEEGMDVWTFFYSKANPVGVLGFYGHWLGVNWVWAMGLAIFHSVYSIGLPIFLFGLVFPDLKSKSLVSGIQLAAVVTCMFFDSIFLYALVSANYSPYSPGGSLILVSLVAITTLVLAAKRLPGDFLKARTGRPSWTPFKFAFAGALLFPLTLLTGSLAASVNAPPMLPFVLDLVFATTLLTKSFKSMGSSDNQEQKVALSIGLLLPIAVFGIIASIGIGNWLILGADLLFIAFSRRLWRRAHLWTLQRQGIQSTLPSFGRTPTPTLPS